MPPTTIRTAPTLDSFTPLADHQSQTPTSFFAAKPVLHFHTTGARAQISKDQVSKLPIFGITDSTIPAEAEPPNNGDADTHGGFESEIVDVFVGSENLILFNTSKSVGISIPYPSIALHAIQRMPDPIDLETQVQSLYMQLQLENDQADSYDDDDDDLDTIDLTLLTTASGPFPNSPTNSIQALYEAVSNCSNLHPDPAAQEDEEMGDADSRIIFEGNVGYEGISGLPGALQGSSDGGLPPPFPGSGGWITAENVGEYFDADGNWIGGAEQESLGEGAGRVRGRDEVEGNDESVTANGHGTDGEEEHKRPRTD